MPRTAGALVLGDGNDVIYFSLDEGASVRAIDGGSGTDTLNLTGGIFNMRYFPGAVAANDNLGEYAWKMAAA